MQHIFITDSDLPPPLPEIAWPFAKLPGSDALSDSEKLDVSGAHVLLVGGEPLLSAKLLDWIETLRAKGATSIEVWTDGRVLARRDAAVRLHALGLSHVGVILFGAEAAAHDFVAATPGHFNAAVRGLRLARKAGLRTSVVAPILRPTFRDLPLLVQRAMAIGTSRFEIVALPGPDRHKHGLLPNLAIAAPHVELAIKQARSGRRVARTWWVPHCLVPNSREHALDLRQIAPNISNHFSVKATAACGQCQLQPSCAGPLAGYFEQHGTAGIISVRQQQ